MSVGATDFLFSATQQGAGDENRSDNELQRKDPTRDSKFNVGSGAETAGKLQKAKLVAGHAGAYRGAKAFVKLAPGLYRAVKRGRIINAAGFKRSRGPGRRGCRSGPLLHVRRRCVCGMAAV